MLSNFIDFFMLEIWCSFWLQFDWYVDWSMKRSNRKWYFKDHPEENIKTLRWEFFWSYSIYNIRRFFRRFWNVLKVIKEEWKDRDGKDHFLFFTKERYGFSDDVFGTCIKLGIWIFIIDIDWRHTCSESDYMDDRNRWMAKDVDIYNQPKINTGIRIWINSWKAVRVVGDCGTNCFMLFSYNTLRGKYYETNPFWMFKKNPIMVWLKKARCAQEIDDIEQMYNQICSDPMNGCPEDFAEDGDRKINHLCAVYSSI